MSFLVNALNSKFQLIIVSGHEFIDILPRDAFLYIFECINNLYWHKYINPSQVTQMQVQGRKIKTMIVLLHIWIPKNFAINNSPVGIYHSQGLKCH